MNATSEAKVTEASSIKTRRDQIRCPLQPEYQIGTWHPHRRRWIGPVTYVQRVDGDPTGLIFVVSRFRFWWICALVVATRTRWIRRPARWALARMYVRYHWTWLPRRGLIARPS